MFPSTGSSIAKSFKGGATKCSYLSSFGLFPYFHEQLVDRIHDAVYAPCYSVLFDECMNKISQNELMDFIVRYWDSDTGQVSVRYLGAEAVSTPVPVANRTLAYRALESGLHPHELKIDRPRTVRAQLN